jgi:hypothetical protein
LDYSIEQKRQSLRFVFILRHYCKAVKATQPAVVTGGTTGTALYRITPPSVEQKVRTPVWFAAAAAAPTT